MKVDPHAGELIPAAEVLDVSKLVRAFFENKPDVSNPAQSVIFGTSGHRGCAFDTSFNEDHILTITQAICRYRAARGFTGPLFLGRDTHAISEQAFHVALEVLGGNGVTTIVDSNQGYTPTPVISHAILTYNKDRSDGLADGIVITPSHNPPEDGGFKYNPPHGGPAETEITDWIEKTANDFLRDQLKDIKRPGQANSSLVLPRDFAGDYIADLEHVVAMEKIAGSGVRIGVDPLGGAATQFWAPIIERYKLNLTVTDAVIDPTFKTIPRDWDGKIRMDCSSPYPMQRLLKYKDAFDVAFANDTDADRHGIVTKAGLMPPNNYLAACAWYLGRHRETFKGRNIGKTIVSSSMIDRVAATLGCKIFEVPVGFKWFVQGLLKSDLYFSGEESAGSCFLRQDGKVWTTDKDGLIAGLLAAEMLAVTGKSPDQIFGALAQELGHTFYERIDSPASSEIRQKLQNIDPKTLPDSLGDDAVEQKLTKAPGDGEAIGGVKIVTRNGWIAVRPSGTEDVIKLYGESYVSDAHLKAMQKAANRFFSLGGNLE